jgi:hypothetical protein
VKNLLVTFEVVVVGDVVKRVVVLVLLPLATLGVEVTCKKWKMKNIRQ